MKPWEDRPPPRAPRHPADAPPSHGHWYAPPPVRRLARHWATVTLVTVICAAFATGAVLLYEMYR